MIISPLDLAPGFQGVCRLDERWTLDAGPDCFWLHDATDDSRRLYPRHAYPFSPQLLAAVVACIESGNEFSMDPKPLPMTEGQWEANGYRTRPPVEA